MDVEKLAKELILKNMTPEQQMAVLDSVRQSVLQAKEVQKKKIGENVDLVVQALKKIESDIRSRFDDVGNAIEKRVASIKDGRDGINGTDGRDGKDGKAGRDGAKGDKGDAGQNGRDGVDGVDGVSVTSARIDFDGSLIITLSSGVELNVGEVVAPDLAERIKVITNGGGTSQSVLDTLASLQTQINNLIPSQTGNSGKFLTTNGTALSWASISGGGLSYQGTWNASTNTPTLASSTGVSGYYYIVATAGSTNLNGITDWQIGDWLLFNGTVWQKIDQSDLVQSITSADGSIVVTTTGSTVDLAVSQTSPASVLVEQVRNSTGATLTKGTAVYISGATGQLPTVTKAQANNDTNSAQTLGLITADISNNSNGYVTIIGLMSNLNTSAFTDGAQLYLSPTTAGTLTATKPYAPNHLVYVAVVAHAHPTQGKLLVKVQNGYEMDELHNVSAQNATDGQVLIYNDTTNLWEKNTLTDGTGITITEGAGSITIANSGVTSAVAGTGISVSSGTGAVTITNTAPDQTVSLTAGTGISTSGTYPSFTITNSAPDQTVALTGAGTTAVTGTYPNFTITSNDAYTGTVTSVGGTGTVNGISLSGTVTSSGNLTLGGTLSNVSLTSQVTGTLPVANGGTGITSLGTGVATWLGTPSSANLASAITGETGSGALVFGTSPTLTTPNIDSAQVPTVSGTAPLYMCRAWVNFNGTANSNLSGTYARTSPSTTLTVTATAHGLIVGNSVNLDFTSGTGLDGIYTVVTVADANTFTITTVASTTTSGNVTLLRNTIRASGNVSSITDNGTGSYTVNFTTAMVDTSYAWSLACNGNASGMQSGAQLSGSATVPTLLSTTAFRFNTGTTSGGTAVDMNDVSAIFIR